MGDGADRDVEALRQCVERALVVVSLPLVADQELQLADESSQRGIPAVEVETQARLEDLAWQVVEGQTEVVLSQRQHPRDECGCGFAQDRVAVGLVERHGGDLVRVEQVGITDTDERHRRVLAVLTYLRATR